MRKLFALLVLILLTAGLVAAPPRRPPRSAGTSATATASTAAPHTPSTRTVAVTVRHLHRRRQLDGVPVGLQPRHLLEGPRRLPAAWASARSESAPLCRFIWQADGNVVIYAWDHPAGWRFGTPTLTTAWAGGTRCSSSRTTACVSCRRTRSAGPTATADPTMAEARPLPGRLHAMAGRTRLSVLIMQSLAVDN